MSNVVDERVVEMTFDNSRFEKNVETSLKTIEKLDKSLEFQNAGKGLNELDRAVSKIDFSPFANAVESISDKFSALEVVATTALFRITNHIMAAGEQLLKSLTVDNISAGWAKFAEITTAEGTLVSQGYSQEDVSSQLERLNWYTDETSYNLTDMVSNISKFTASGKDLESSVTAMEGIANWSAMAGQNVTTASRAMYQISQAMGAGVMRKEDWRSIQNANMDTKEFREHAIEAAVALGTLRKEANGTYTSLVSEGKTAVNFTRDQFADSLTQGRWFTSDVMMRVFNEYSSAVNGVYKATEAMDDEFGVEVVASQVLKSYNALKEGEDAFRDYAESIGLSADATNRLQELVGGLDEFGVKALRAAQEARTFSDAIEATKDAVSTGWMKTFRYIFGDYEEAKELWTDLSEGLWDVFASGINERNEVLKTWHDVFNGRNDLFGEGGAFYNIAGGVVGVLNNIKEAFREVFPPMTAGKLKQLTAAFRNFTERVHFSEETIQNFKSTWKGVFAVFKIIGSVLKAVWHGFTRILEIVKPLGGGMLRLTGRFGEWLAKLAETIEESKIFEKVVDGIINTVLKMIDVFKRIGSVIKTVFVTIWNILKSIGIFVWEHFLSPIWSIITSIGNKLREHFSWIGDIFHNISKNAKEADSDGNSLLSKIKTAFTSGDITGFLRGLFDAIRTVFEGLVNLIDRGFTTLNQIIDNAHFDRITDLANMLISGSLASSFSKLSGSASGFLKALNGGKGILDWFSDSSLMKKINDTVSSVQGFIDQKRKGANASAILKIAVAIGILAASLVALSLVDSKKLMVSLGVVTIIISEMAAFMTIFNSLASNKDSLLKKVGMPMITLSIAILLIANAIKKIGSLPISKIKAGLAAVSIIMLELAGFALLMTAFSTEQKSFLRAAASLFVLSLVVVILSLVVAGLAKVPFTSLTKALVAVGGMMLMMVIVTALMSFINGQDRSFLRAAGSLFILSVVTVILALVVAGLAKIPFTSLTKALVAVGGMMMMFVLITGAMSFINKEDRSFLRAAGSLFILAIVTVILSLVVTGFAKIPFTSLTKALVAVGGLMLMFVTVSALMSLIDKEERSFFRAAGSLAILTVLVVILSLVVTGLSKIPFNNLLTGLIGIGSILGMLVAVAATMALISKENRSFILASLSLLLLAGVVAALAAIARSFSSMSVGEVIKSVAALAAIMGVLVLSILALGKVSGVMVAVGKGLAFIGLGASVIGLALVLIGAGLTMIGAGITTLNAAAASGVVAAEANKLQAQIVLETIKVVLLGILDIVADVLKKLVEMAPVIAETLVLIGVIGMEKFLAKAAVFIRGVLTFVEMILDALIEYGPALVDKLFTLIVMVLTKLTERMPELLLHAGEFAKAFREGFVAAFGREFNPNSLKAVFAAIIGITGFVVALGLLKKQIKSAIGSVVLILVLVAGLTAAFVILSHIDVYTIVTITVSLMAIAVTIAGVIIVLSNIPFTGAINAVAAFAIFLAGLVGILAILGGIAQIPGFTWLLEEGTKVLGTLGNAIGTFVGSIVSGFWVSASSGLPEVGTNLSNFMTNFQPFIDGAKSIDSSMVTNLETLAAAIMVLTTSKVIDGIANFLGMNQTWDEFGQELVAFAPYLVEYANSLSGVNNADLTAAANAASLIGDFVSKVPREGGALQALIGEKHLSSFGQELAEFGPNFKIFADSLDGLSSDTVTAAASSALAVAEFARKIPNEGGALAALLGENSLSAFGAMLPGFASNFNEFVTNLGVVDETAVTSAMNAAKSVAEFAKKIPNEGGALSFFLGDNSLAQFGDQLPHFATNFSVFSSRIRNVDTSVVTASIAAAESIAAFANNLPDTGGLAQWLTGEQNLTNFSLQIKDFGNNFKQYYTSIQDISAQKVNLVTDAVVSIVDLQKAILTNDATGTSHALKKFGQDLADFGFILLPFYNDVVETIDGTQLDAIMGTILNFCSGMAGLSDRTTTGLDSLANFFDKFKDVRTFMDSFAKVSVDSYVDYVNTRAPEIEQAGASMVTHIIAGMMVGAIYVQTSIFQLVESIANTVKAQKRSIYDIGTKIVQIIGSGIKDGKIFATSPTNTIASDIISAIKAKYNDAVEAGKLLILGLSAGMNVNAAIARNSAEKIALNVLNAINTVFDVNSPSREAYYIGSMVAVGLINALTDYASLAGDAGYILAEGANKGLNGAIDSMLRDIQTEFDDTITIRPILDLSNVASGARDIDTLLNQSQLHAISEEMDREAASIPGVNKSKGGAVFNFTQNNYSPKALSRNEIYRQTHTQLTKLERIGTA